ncbi:hypothetical protein HOLleu_01662 [Holothuria leucospilota]|uniref:Uncharacterized protein n=1 Tax=Holothuria leucospilota TaxID=206669 RepID=A0A9Q1CRB1_HOLLE|nr:hypothetical protein HOLleu_01662 [Holothuria leucospilota]
MTRTEILRSFLTEKCVTGCEGDWLQLATNILHRNEIPLETFTSAIFEAVEKGRGKYRNVLITGPANCDKTFILSPLTEIFHAFCNPVPSSSACVGSDKAEIIFFNDFMWKQEIIPWHDMLILLEGQLVHLPAPKSHFSQNIVFEWYHTRVCTRKHELIYIKGTGRREGKRDGGCTLETFPLSGSNSTARAT